MDAPETSPPRIEVYSVEGSWVWSYTEGGLTLMANKTFDSADAALASARRAYPDLPDESIHLQAATPSNRSFRLRDLFVGMLVLVLARRNRRPTRGRL